MSNKMRSPICAVMGHVDHGKSSVLDFVRESSVVTREAGGITQAIGASIVPSHTLKNLCIKTLGKVNEEQFKIPGLLFIDTPGHAAFTNLRKRGGNLADIAILVVDINEGLMPQTIEALQILKQYKTPFVIAANKIDLFPQFRSNPKQSVLKTINQQQPATIQQFETKFYELVGKIYEHMQMEADRFDRVSDFTKQLAIVPTSAKQGDGLAELLMIVSGLAQKFLEKNLEHDIGAPAKGTILEVKEEQGIGTALDVIIYDGNIKTGDIVVAGTMNGVVSSKVRCLFEPAPMSDMMDKKSKYKAIKQAFAATGVKIAGPGLDDVVAGMPIRVVGPNETIDSVSEKILEEVDEVTVDTDDEGIVVKADSLGSLEALTGMLRAEGISVRKATVGEISRKDFADAESSLEKDRLHSVILGFNIKQPEEHEGVSVFTSNVIYSLIDNFKEWTLIEKKKIELEKLAGIPKPAKVEFLKNHTFRQSNPAVIGVEVLGGKLTSGGRIMSKTGQPIGTVKQIQKDNKSVTEAVKGDQVAISIDGATVGRQIEEEDIMYSAIIESDFLKFKKIREFLLEDEKEVLKEIAEIMRENNPVWGV